MKKMFTLFVKGGMVAAAMFALQANAGTFTAILSGNFSSSTSWSGGLVPPPSVSADDIIIPLGIKITLDQDQEISGTGSLTVDGSLEGGTGKYLSMTTGTLNGSGSIMVDSFHTSFTSGFNYTGSITTGAWHNANAMIDKAATITVNSALRLMGGALDMADGNLVLGTGATIYVAGGVMTTNGGSLSLNNDYHVVYLSQSTAGLELSGSGLTNITVNVPAASSVMLSENLDVSGMLMLTSGTLNLNGKNLVFETTGDLQGNGYISSSSNSDITINATAGLTGGIKFINGGNTVDDFTVNLGSGTSKVMLNSGLMVAGQLALQTGRLDADSYDVNLMTNATLTGGSSSSYVVTGTGGTLSLEVAPNATQSFHVGTSNDYAPVMIKGNGTSATSKFSVGVNGSVMQNGTGGATISDVQPMVKATWFIASSASANVNVDIETRWNSNMEVNSFDRNKAYISHYTNGSWDATASAAATMSGSMYVMKRTGITSFSPFAVFDENTATGVNDLALAGGVKIFPVPASDVINITIANGKDAAVNIYSVAGNLVASGNVSAGNTAINVSALPAGVYYARIGVEGQYGVQKFVKQ